MISSASTVDLRQLVREIPDFPKPGILFRDLTPLMRDVDVWQEVIRRLALQCEPLQADLIVGIESRGFIVGMALSMVMGLGFVPIRKPGKLPGPLHRVDYELEYGSDRLEIQTDSFVTITPSASGGGFEKFCQGETDANDASDAIDAETEAACRRSGVVWEEIQVANDALTEGPEVLEIRIFADSEHRHKLGETVFVTINDSSSSPACSGKRVLVIDDLLATGGTAAAAGELVTLAGGQLCGFGFVIELAGLSGRQKLQAGVPAKSLVVYS
ncbi:MAG: adenine phosphoribosyltransferase [Cyanobacteria bacterium]|nr:adenine phosphoribosyltransferase [Cyanobacteriota bacterium]